MRRWLSVITGVGVASAILGFIATPAASAQQSFNFYMGGFEPTSADARGDIAGGISNDVLVQNQQFLSFRIKDFDGFTFGGSGWSGLVTTSTGPRPQLLSGDGVRGRQQLREREWRGAREPQASHRAVHGDVPCAALGHHAPVQPYVGGGVGVFGWRYSEYGQFVDPTDLSIFNGTFVGSGTAVGPVLLGGVRVPIGPTAVGFEARWQSAKGDLPTNQEFAGTKIDLGGMNYLFTFNIRF